MNVEFTGTNIKITDALKNLMLEKINHIETHLDHITSAHVTFKVDKLEQIAEAKLHVPGKTIFAEASSDDMYKSIDLLKDKLMRQIDKYKEKEADHRS